MKFFISYNHSEVSLAQATAKALDEEGISYFLDEKDIEYGSDIRAEISEHLDSSTHIVVIISPGSIKSLWYLTRLELPKPRG